MNDASTSADHAPNAREILLESGRRLLLGALLLRGLVGVKAASHHAQSRVRRL
ncbi:hypothetical protein [Paraburkholderia guartelaensis]|uniref:Uncharacterized protein n=1 Tax=Paraburkholderia guartelaensis TaxID=2546446 RepID=A0ABU9SJZ1_9BURK